MIQATIHLANDKEVCSPIWFRSVPRVGELLWIVGATTPAVTEKHGSSSFQVVEVAHWCGPDWSPGTHTGEPIHSVCLYVEPTKPST